MVFIKTMVFDDFIFTLSLLCQVYELILGILLTSPNKYGPYSEVQLQLLIFRGFLILQFARVMISTKKL